MIDFIFSVDFVWWLLLILYFPACFALIVIVLLQKGKGVGFAGAFGMGGGGSDAVFGPRSVKTLPQKLTYTAAAVFMVMALVLSVLAGMVGKGAAPALEQEEAAISSGVSVDDLLSGAATEEAAAAPVEEEAAAPAEAPAPAEEPAPAPSAEEPAAQ